ALQARAKHPQRDPAAYSGPRGPGPAGGRRTEPDRKSAGALVVCPDVARLGDFRIGLLLAREEFYEVRRREAERIDARRNELFLEARLLHGLADFRREPLYYRGRRLCRHEH